MSGTVSGFLAQRLQKRLRQHQVVLWYDPERSFEAFARAFASEGTRKLELNESLFRLRREAEALVGHLRAGEGDAECLLIYVPREQLDPRSNVLLPLESLGTVITDNLDALARDALRDAVPAAKLEEWRRLPGLTLAKWDHLAESEGDIGPLDAVFGKVGPRQIGFEFLRHEERADEVEAQGLLEQLRALLLESFGVAVAADVQDARRMRDAFALRVLLNEFLSDLREIPQELGTFTLPEPASRVSACRELAQRLRDSKGLESQYREWAESAVRLFGLDRPNYDAEQLGVRDTFEFEADYALRHVESLALGDRWQDARTWVEHRSRSFWTEVDQRRADGWRLARLATELWLAADAVSARMPAKKKPPREWVDLYTAKDGAWRVDSLLRRLNSGLGVLPQAQELATLMDRARERAEAIERVQAERFFDSLMGATGELAELASQTEVYAKEVAPLISRSRTVYVLADALRFEMAHELAELLSPTGSVELSCAVATPPTITKVGMAALVPGAEAGVTLASNGDDVVPVVAGHALPGLPQRLARFEAELGSQVADITLDACLSLKQGQLEKRYGGSRLLLLRAQELDQIGELDNLHKARTLMGAVIPDLVQAINRLAHLGFTEFVVCADHGFLLRDDITDSMKLDRPVGEVLEVHRRSVIGRHLAAGEHYSVVKASELGIGGDLELAFPRGINVFRTPGNMVYHHGGVSLQELIVPVLRYTSALRKDSPRKPVLTLELKGGKKVTNAIFQVALTYQSVDLLDQRRRFRLTVAEPESGKQVGETILATEGFREAGSEVELESGATSMLVVRLTDPPTGTGDFELQVADVEAGETILRKKVKYDLAF